MSGEFLIAGGGLGGLGAALALAKVGRRSIVLEQASQFGEIGAGIQMAPNAFHSFDYLGVTARASEGAVFVDNLIVMDALHGDRIIAIPTGEAFRRRMDNPYAVVHRADLHAALLDSCRASGLVDLRGSSQVTRYAQDGGEITAFLANGGRVTGAALIGADGLWSAVRSQVVGDGEPVVSGHTTFRSVIPTEQMPPDLRWNAATLWAGPHVHIVHYPLKGWKVFNLVVTCDNGAPAAAAGVPVDREEMRKNFLHVCPQVMQVLDMGTDWKYWVLCDREPVSDWADGRAVLLGDAAHPTLQYYAQGACMALEDAVCLSRMVDAYPDDLPRAFSAYNRLRAPRTGRIQMGSRLMGELIFHPDGAKAEIRNAALRANSPDDFNEGLSWLYAKAAWERATGMTP